MNDLDPHADDPFLLALRDFDNVESLRDASGRREPSELALQVLLNDRLDASLQVDAARALYCLAVDGYVVIERAATALIEVVQENERFDESGRSVAWFATIALGAVGGESASAIALLTEQLDHADSRLAGAAAHALGEVGPNAAGAIPRLIDGLRSTTRPGIDDLSELPWTAAQALVRMGAAAVCPLGETLEDPSSDVRRRALECLGAIGERAREAIPRMVERLRDSDGNVRSSALRALRNVGWQPDEPARAWARLLLEGDESQRIEAASALRSLGGAAKEVLPEVIRATSDSEAEVRWRSLAVIRELGPQAESSVPELIRALRDPNDFVRSYAALALYKVSPDTPRVLDNEQPPGWIDLIRRDLEKME